MKVIIGCSFLSWRVPGRRVAGHPSPDEAVLLMRTYWGT